MDGTDRLSDADLAAINLRCGARGLAIVWPRDANVHAMTLGRHLGAAMRDRPAMINETATGAVETLCFAQVDRAATGLAASLSALGVERAMPFPDLRHVLIRAPQGDEIDLAVQDADGYFWYKGRSDDLINSWGFRIGPAEIEACLLSHPAVAECAVVGKPDTERGSIVKAIVGLRGAGEAGSPTLATALAEHVRTRLAAYKAPREVAFVDAFPLTSSGKIDRRPRRETEAATGGT